MIGRIPITILSGYLGAGKTTMINRVLSGDPGRRVAVLVNDFGAVNIDASLIATQEDDRISLTNGCVCCSIGDDLGAALDDQAARADPPEHILLEASGVAEPKRVAMHAGYWPGFTLDALIVVVDAETIRARAKDKFVGKLIRSQIAAAEIIALTKTDLIGPDMAQSVIGFLRGIAPDVRVIEAPNGSMPNDLIFGSTGVFRAPFQTGDDTDHAALHTVTWIPQQAVSQRKLDQALKSSPTFIHRAKGFFVDADTDRMMLLQAVGARFSFDAAPADMAPAIVMIGTGAPADMSAEMDRIRQAVG
ncbi:CobW family GTP-binding protein [Yoonia sp. SS1-5]|uniref:CobW family GTP-binding protein n=1 Tax=Yoonia rhodophyticola TaxID=3137370 RepID=A0AAN0NIZ2_9RHOB